MFKQLKVILLSTLLIFTIAGCSNNDTATESSSQAGSTPTQSSSVAVAVSSQAASSVAESPPTESSETESPPTESSETESPPTESSETESLPTESSEAESAVPEESSSASTNDGVNIPATETAAATTTTTVGELTVHFGDDGAPFTMHLYDNSTAAAIASYVGTADWRLPIYNYDGYDNWEVMQYYDLPSRYEIPANTETITTEKAGEVFYSEPNRIVLFYGDGEVSGEYSRIGYFEATEEFVSAVQNNPVLEGWGNKIVLIKE